MKRHQIKVFHPNSKKADFSILSVSSDAGVDKLSAVLGEEAATKVKGAFASLKLLGADYVSLRAGNRKIKVQLAQAA